MRAPRHRRTWLALGIVALGLSFLGASWGVSDAPFTGWASAALVNVGVGVFLVVPIYVLNERLGRRVDAAQAQAHEEVSTLADRVTDFEADVARRLDDVADAVTRRLAEEARADADSFSALGDSPTRGVVRDACRRAFDLGLIDAQRGPRVSVSDDDDLYVRLDYEPGRDVSAYGDEERLAFVVERIDGSDSKWFDWPEGDSLEDAMVRIGREVLARQRPGASFDTPALMNGLTDALQVARSDPARRPIYEVCRPQWAVTSRGVVTLPPMGAYSVGVGRLRELDAHVKSKPWVDADSFERATYSAISLLGDSAGLSGQAPF